LPSTRFVSCRGSPVFWQAARAQSDVMRVRAWCRRHRRGALPSRGADCLHLLCRWPSAQRRVACSMCRGSVCTCVRVSRYGMHACLRFGSHAAPGWVGRTCCLSFERTPLLPRTNGHRWPVCGRRHEPRCGPSCQVPVPRCLHPYACLLCCRHEISISGWFGGRLRACSSR
jgi:hypothetical protein